MFWAGQVVCQCVWMPELPVVPFLWVNNNTQSEPFSGTLNTDPTQTVDGIASPFICVKGVENVV